MKRTVLDACCGSKMFWFNRKDPRALYMDNRQETSRLKDKSSKGGYRTLNVCPDIIADFRSMPFRDGTFLVVIFDPPHLTRGGEKSWLTRKYGMLAETWREDLKAGFRECFRVLKEGGTLIFKWNECRISLKEILVLTPHAPLIGHVSGRQSKTHWVLFLKEKKP